MKNETPDLIKNKENINKEDDNSDENEGLLRTKALIQSWNEQFSKYLHK